MVVTRYALIVLALLIMSLTLCLTQTSTSPLKFKVPDSGTKFWIKVKVGNYFNVLLKYPTVSYEWRVKNFKDIKTWLKTLNLDVDGYCKDSTSGTLPGAGGYFICKFRAIKTNVYGVPVIFQLKRRWETHIERTVNLRVIIS